MDAIKELQERCLRFRDERDWGQFHSPKNLAISLTVEASELLELYAWKGAEEPVDLARVKDELADVFYSALLLAAHYGIDIPAALEDKLEKNAEKYPVEVARGSNKKYDEPR